MADHIKDPVAFLDGFISISENFDQLTKDCWKQVKAMLEAHHNRGAPAFNWDEFDAWFAGCGVVDDVSPRLAARLGWQAALKKYAHETSAPLEAIPCTRDGCKYGGPFPCADRLCPFLPRSSDV